MVVILFGVSGAGKTVIGQSLAQDLGWQFFDGDDFHSAASIEKMRAGIPLGDHDRKPWLESLRELIERHLNSGQHAVLACSSLKASYRDILRVSDCVKFVYLRGDYAVIAGRLRNRTGHFMNPDLLKSQFVDLEEPRERENALTVEVDCSPSEIVSEIRRELDLAR